MTNHPNKKEQSSQTEIDKKDRATGSKAAPAGDNRSLGDQDGNRTAGNVKSPGPNNPEVE
jgi:hypothetical protein